MTITGIANGGIGLEIQCETELDPFIFTQPRCMDGIFSGKLTGAEIVRVRWSEKTLYSFTRSITQANAECSSRDGQNKPPTPDTVIK